MNANGRLSLQSNKLRMDDDVTSSMLYYMPFDSNDFTQIPLALNGIKKGNLYDVYLDGTSLILTDPWLNNSTPSIARVPCGTLYFDSSERLYLGTIHAIEDDFVKWQTRPVATAYGCNNELGLFNAYNRLPVEAINRNLNTTWNYASSSLRLADNSNRFRINWVDGLGDVCCKGVYLASVAGANSSAAAATIGVGLDQDSYPLNWDGALEQAALNNTASGIPLRGTNWVNGIIGRHFWQAIEQSTSVPISFYGNNFACLTIELSV